MVIRVGLTVEQLHPIDPYLLVPAIAGDDVNGVPVPLAIVRGVEADALVDVLRERIGLAHASLIVSGELHADVFVSGRAAVQQRDAVGVAASVWAPRHEPLESRAVLPTARRISANGRTEPEPGVNICRDGKVVGADRVPIPRNRVIRDAKSLASMAVGYAREISNI